MALFSSEMVTMDIETQIKIMEAQLSNFTSLMDKLQYLTYFFDPDPEFTKKARDIVRSNIAASMK